MTVAVSDPTDVIAAAAGPTPPEPGNQYVDLLPADVYVEVDLDSTFADLVSDAYLYARIFIPSSAKPDIAANAGSISGFIQSDNFSMGIHSHGGGTLWDWWAGSGAGTDFSPVTFDDFTEIEVHAVAGASTYDVRIDGVLYTAIPSAFLPATGINFWSVGSLPASWVGDGGGSTADDTIQVDQLAWSVDNWVSLGGTVFARWAFDGADPIGDATANYPDPPWAPWENGDPANIVVQTGGDDERDLAPGEAAEEGPGATPDEAGPYVQVFIDNESATACIQSGSVTRRLNRPWDCTLRLYSECAIGTPCSKIKVFVGSTLWFHGFVMQISTEAGEDGTLISEYTCLDPMMLWQWRVARDGPASGDPGDFSNPLMFTDQFYTPMGPFILEQMLIQSEDDSDPGLGEGPLFIDLAGATYATGVTSLKGAPVDWPMTIAEVFELMSSTGVLDAVLTPIDTGGNMASLAVYNGDYGTDRTATVAFEYATGDHNVKQVRMTEDSSNVCNKLWYYLGPRVLGPNDPAGDQHWRANIQGDDAGLARPPGGDVVSPYTGGDAPGSAGNPLGQRRLDSQEACGVRMEVRIYDAQGDEHPASGKELFRRLWQMESWLRSVPRTLIHVTPVRTSQADQLPPGVTPIQVGDFDIGDLVTVTAGAIVRGGFTGAQRVYAYTVSWDEDGVVEVGELQTSADQEGIIT